MTILSFSVFLGYFGTKQLAISCFHCLQNKDVIKFDQFVSYFQLQYNNGNQHYYLNIPNFSYILHSVTKILAILCFPYLKNECHFLILKISAINYLYILYFITKILALHVFIVFRMTTSSNLIDLTVDSNFNTISETSIIS